jgi:DNA-binding NarL/FixJ family response regulator
MALHAVIVERGWTAAFAEREALKQERAVLAAEPREVGDSRRFGPPDRPRLVLRRHPYPTTTAGPHEWTLRLPLAGRTHYFPLGTADEEAAALAAHRIGATVERGGWEAADRLFRREMTIAIYWAMNPVGWTYFTFHTHRPRQDAGGPPPAPPQPGALPVAVVDSDAAVRAEMRACINRQARCACCGAFSDGTTALARLAHVPAAVVLINSNLAPVPATELAEGLRQRLPGAPCLLYGVYDDSDEVFVSTPGGASGYFLKRTPPDRILEPLQASFPWSPLSPEALAQRVRAYFEGIVSLLPAGVSPREWARLTQRENEILALLGKGYLDKEIADELRISVWTVHAHVKKVFEKLGVHTRTEAAIRYLQK